MTRETTVGRDEELGLLTESLLDRRPLVIAGTAGVGKTHLARALVDRAAADGWQTRWVTATTAAAGVPLGLFGSVLSGQHGAVSRLDLLNRAAQALAGDEGSPVLVAVDDAHRADETSAALVHRLAQERTAAVLVTIRSGEAVPDAIQALWKDEGGTRLDLQPLSEHESGQLLGHLVGGQIDLGTVHRLWAASQGNPLWLRELVLAGMEAGLLRCVAEVWRWSGPLLAGSRLPELIADRLGDLPRSERLVVETLAIADAMPAALVEPVLTGEGRSAETPTDPLEELERRGLVRMDQDGRRWSVHLAHPLYGESVRAQLPQRQIQRLTTGLAAALSATGARRRDDVVRLATWALEGGAPVDPAVLVEAALLARDSLDPTLSLKFLEVAVLAGAGPDARLALAHGHFAAGSLDEAERILVDLTADPDLTRDDAVSAAILLAMFHWYARRAADEALSLLDATAVGCGDNTRRDEVVAARAGLLAEAGRVGEASALVTPILARGAKLKPLVRARHAVVWSLPFCGRADEATRVAEEGWEDALRLSDALAFPTAAILTGRCRAHWVRGEFNAALHLAEHNHREATIRAADEVRAVWGVMLGRLHLATGRIGEAVAVLRETSAVLNVDAHSIGPSCLGLLATASAQAGIPVPETAAAGRATLDDTNRMWQTDVVMGEAWCAAAGGERSRAAALLAAEGEQAGERGLYGFAMLALHDALRLGADVAEALQAICGEVDGPLADAVAAHAAAGRNPDGLLACAETFATLGANLIAAEAAAAAVLAYRAEARAGSALSAEAMARRLAALCSGAVTPALAMLGEPRALAALTAREREIATLAGQGMTKREIAERLVISIRTVGNHLYNIYGKLGVSSREELAAAMKTAF